MSMGTVFPSPLGLVVVWVATDVQLTNGGGGGGDQPSQRAVQTLVVEEGLDGGRERERRWHPPGLNHEVLCRRYIMWISILQSWRNFLLFFLWWGNPKN